MVIYQQYSPNMAPTNLNNTSPMANLLYLTPPGSSNNSVSSTSSSQSNSAASSLFGSTYSNNSSYSFNNNTPRLRCLLSKSFEDDVEFCPEIPEHYQYNHSYHSPTMKKFNPYTATTFSPKETITKDSTTNSNSLAKSPRVSKPIEIINPNTRAKVTYKSRTNSPATSTAIHNK